MPRPVLPVANLQPMPVAQEQQADAHIGEVNLGVGYNQQYAAQPQDVDIYNNPLDLIPVPPAQPNANYLEQVAMDKYAKKSIYPTSFNHIEYLSDAELVTARLEISRLALEYLVNNKVTLKEAIREIERYALRNERGQY